MNVLLISNVFPNSAERTRGVFTYQIARSIQKMCHIRVVAPLPYVPKFIGEKRATAFPYASAPRTELIEGIRVYHPRYLVIPKILGFMHAVFMFLPLLRTTRELDRSRRIDVINAHWIYPDGVASTWVARLLKKPIVLTALGCDINQYAKMPQRKFQIEAALRNADAVTAVCDSIKDNILDLNVSSSEVTVIPNGVDTDLFRIVERNTARKRLGLPLNRRIILTVGSQDEVKGTKYLVEAFANLTTKCAPIPLLVLVGDGPLRDALVKQAHELGISDHVTFAGKRPHDEIPLWMNAADVFCLPSIREGHPNVVIEALACGTPVVGTAVGAVEQIISPSLGRVALKANALDISRLLIQVLDSNWDRQEIRESVARYSWQDCGLLYLKVLRSLVVPPADRSGILSTSSPKNLPRRAYSQDN